MRIQRTDIDGTVRLVGPSFKNVGLAVYEMAKMARSEAESIPSRPFMDQSGHQEISIYVGYRQEIVYSIVD